MLCKSDKPSIIIIYYYIYTWAGLESTVRMSMHEQSSMIHRLVITRSTLPISHHQIQPPITHHQIHAPG